MRYVLLVVNSCVLMRVCKPRCLHIYDIYLANAVGTLAPDICWWHQRGRWAQLVPSGKQYTVNNKLKTQNTKACQTYHISVYPIPNVQQMVFILPICFFVHRLGEEKQFPIPVTFCLLGCNLLQKKGTNKYMLWQLLYWTHLGVEIASFNIHKVLCFFAGKVTVLCFWCEHKFALIIHRYHRSWA